MKKMKPDDFRAPQGARIDLSKWPTRVAPVYRDDADYEDQLRSHVKKLSEQQQRLYASSTYAVLLIFQAMDAAGKDGVIAHVMSGVNPQGCQVYSYKHPSTQELAHDFLWRTTRDLPERGRIGIFNRSYYEEVLIVRVHKEILASEHLPRIPASHKRLWQERYRSIDGLERHLDCNGTRIVKFFLHLSREEQRKRFLARLDDPNKNWKFSAADLEERKYWDQYARAYEKCISATSTRRAPWYIVPADDKQNARLIVSRVVLDTLEDLKLEFPTVTPQRKQELRSLRRRLVRDR
ncbi:MAG TPA: ADP-polyphosphate phosphotransferase [Steroidobacteraceae bacterium]|nr:ADP-polyphosphate phosphotransferase [Steroidobacteraceae bacterium]